MTTDSTSSYGTDIAMPAPILAGDGQDHDVEADDDNDTCDYGSESENDHARTVFIQDHMPETKPNKLRVKTESHTPVREERSHPYRNISNGETGSSTGSNVPVLPYGNPFSSMSSTDGIDSLTSVVASLGETLKRESREREEENKARLVQEANQLIELARTEEAWTAHQMIVQVQHNAQHEAMRNAERLREVELRAESLIADTANAASRERESKADIIEEAKSVISSRDNKLSEQEQEIARLKQMLYDANHRADAARRETQSAIQRISEDKQNQVNQYERAIQELRAQSMKEAQERELRMENKMMKPIEDQHAEQQRRARVHVASDTVQSTVKDLALYMDQFMRSQQLMNQKLEGAILGLKSGDKTEHFEIHSQPGDTITSVTRPSRVSGVSSSNPMLNPGSNDRGSKRNDDNPPRRPNGDGGRMPGGDDPDDWDRDWRKDKGGRKFPNGGDPGGDDGDGDDDDFDNGEPAPGRGGGTGPPDPPPPKVKTKEADVIKLVALPERAGQFRSWRLSTRRKVIAASADPNGAYQWIKEVEDPKTSFDSFRDSGKFSTLDSKLGSAISDMSKGELGRRIILATEREDKDGRNVTGRQLLKIIYEFYKTDEYVGIVYDVSDLTQVKVKGDNPGWRQLLDFRDLWDETLAGIEKEPEVEILEALFKTEVRKCQCLSHDLGIYDRALKGSAERSYQFLYDAVQRLLARKQSDLNRSDIQRTRKEGNHMVKTNDRRGRSRERNAAPSPVKKKKSVSKTRDNSRGHSPSDRSKGGKKKERSTSSKKGVCYSWKNSGKCAKHEKGECPYSHDESDRSSSSSRSSGSDGRKPSPFKRKKGKGKGKGKGRGNRSLSPADKKKVSCYFYLNDNCSKGADCDFKHDPKELEKAKKKGGKGKDKKDFQ